MGMGGQRNTPAALLPGKRLGSYYMGSWVGPRANLDGCGKCAPTGIRSLDCPARGKSLYYFKHTGFCHI